MTQFLILFTTSYIQLQSESFRTCDSPAFVMLSAALHIRVNYSDSVVFPKGKVDADSVNKSFRL